MLIAKAWISTCEDTDAAVRCMTRAEAAARNSVALLEIARSWKYVVKNLDEAARCMHEAEATAESSEEFMQLAQEWKGSQWSGALRNSHAAFRCMEKAKDVARSSEELAMFEQALHRFSPIPSRSTFRNTIYTPLDGWGPIDIMMARIADSELCQQGAVVDLGFLDGHVAKIGTWCIECKSKRRLGCFARYFHFALGQPADVIIEFTSLTADTCLYLIAGDIHTGLVLDENATAVEVTKPRILRRLPAGTYAVEAVADSSKPADSFTLTISSLQPL